KIGSFGRFQKIQYLLACFAAVCCSWAAIVPVYILNVPKHRCRVPRLGPADHWGINSSLIEADVPLKKSGCAVPGAADCFEACRLNGGNGTNSTTGCSAGFVFDKSEFIDTFPSELNYVCDAGREVLVTTLVQSQLIGVLIGAWMSGILSDRFGRKPVLIGSMLLMGLSGLASTVSSDPYSFWCFGIEFIGPQARIHAGIVIQYAYAVGLILLVGVAHLLRYWRWLNIAVGALPLFSILLIWLLVESPRWLISRGRLAEAEALIRKAAKVNGVELPTDLELRPPSENVSKTPDSESADDSDRSSPTSSTTKSSEQTSFLRVFTNKQTALMTMNMFLQWWVIALVYYGLSLSSGNLPGDIYLTSFLNALAELIGYVVPHALAGRLGRRVTHAGSMFLAAAALCSTIFVELFGPADGGLDWLLRKFIASSFGAALPLLISGCLALLAGLTSLLLPETLGIELPETLEDCRRLAAWRSRATVEPQDVGKEIKEQQAVDENANRDSAV
uniref:MFS domain-containing protein n=1 Tax=Macrostomum lignano TaxID=282301 RepID=A0A1I8HI45_9PLAT